MTQQFAATNLEINRRIHAMLEERGAQDVGEGVTPSRYWSDFARQFQYLSELSEKSLRNLRIHTYHLTGDNYQHYFFYEDPQLFFIHNAYDGLVEGLPEEMLIQEPEMGIGLRHSSGRLVSLDIIRYQRIVRSLYNNGCLKFPHPPTILEIGGGYGGLALHLSRAIPDVRYIIVDLPETLIFSANYLNQHAPGKVYIYDSETFPAALANGFADFTFILLPNYVLGRINLQVDLAISVESLQEMTTAQVKEYAEFLAHRTSGRFYCWNKDRNPKNYELESLYGILGRLFHITELELPPPPPRPFLRRNLRKLAEWMNLADRSATHLEGRIRECILDRKAPAK